MLYNDTMKTWSTTKEVYGVCSKGIVLELDRSENNDVRKGVTF